LIAACRNIAWGDRFVRANNWENKVGSLTLGTRVSGKKLGVVGLGRIGEAIARRGLGFDMEVAYHNRSARKDVDYRYIDSLVELARWSDFLVIATVGGPSTKGLINEEVLRALGPKGIVVNIARGTVIDAARQRNNPAGPEERGTHRTTLYQSTQQQEGWGRAPRRACSSGVWYPWYAGVRSLQLPSSHTCHISRSRVSHLTHATCPSGRSASTS
jgi:hypothetical protein